MSNLLSYKNYSGTVEYSKEDFYVGKIDGINRIKAKLSNWDIEAQKYKNANSHKEGHQMQGIASLLPPAKLICTADRSYFIPNLY